MSAAVEGVDGFYVVGLEADVVHECRTVDDKRCREGEMVAQSSLAVLSDVVCPVNSDTDGLQPSCAVDGVDVDNLVERLAVMSLARCIICDDAVFQFGILPAAFHFYLRVADRSKVGFFDGIDELSLHRVA